MGSYLHDAVADGAVRLPAHQQEADYHHHGDRHGHHQQTHHGASVERLQGIGLLRTEMSGEPRSGKTWGIGTELIYFLPVRPARSQGAC